MAQTQPVDHHQRDRHGEQRGDRGKGEAIGGIGEETRVDHPIGGLHRPVEEHRTRQQEAQEYGQETGGGSGGRLGAGQSVARQSPVTAGGVTDPAAAARQAFDQDQGENEDHQGRRQLRRRLRFAHAEPGAEDAGGEIVDGEVLHGAEIIERLHQRQGHPGGDSRPRQRQGHGKKAPPWIAAERAADLEDGDRLLEEGGPRQQIDIGVEHQRHHGDGAADAANLREPVIAFRQAEGVAQETLDRSGELEQAGIGVGDDVGRHRQGKHQGPLEYRPPPKPAHGDEPGGPDTDDEGAGADPDHQPQRINDIAGEYRLREVGPDIARGDEEMGEHHQDRHRNQRRDTDGEDRPAVEPMPPGATSGPFARIGRIGAQRPSLSGPRSPSEPTCAITAIPPGPSAGPPRRYAG